MRPMSRAATGGVALAALTGLALAGCTPAGPAAFQFPIDCEEEAATPYEHEYDSTSTGPAEGLTYTIGTALPVTGTLAFLGPPEISATDYAASVVNEADKGITIDLIQGDSGDNDNKAYETEVPRILNAGATAVVGAASSGTSLQFIDQVIGAGAVQFSPANTSAAFTSYEDEGLYFRTAPSDTLQGEVLGNLIASDGAETVGMMILNDSYGTGLACFTKESFEAAGGEVVSAVTFNTGDTNFSAQISELLAADPDAIALITFDEAKTIVPDLAAQYDMTKVYFVDGNLANYSADFEPGLLEGAKGTYPSLDPAVTAEFRTELDAYWTGLGNAPLEEFTYAPESFDAVVLLALAALEAGSTAGPDVAAHLANVSGTNGGTKCLTYAECADLIIAGETVDYDGVSGPITFDGAGDPTEASMGIFQFIEDNTYEWLAQG